MCTYGTYIRIYNNICKAYSDCYGPPRECDAGVKKTPLGKLNIQYRQIACMPYNIVIIWVKLRMYIVYRDVYYTII